MSACAKTYQEVFDFWFVKDADITARLKLWFLGGPEGDKIIKEKFGDLVVKARNGELSDWEDLKCGIHGGIAFIVLIDQFCRNIYRGTSDSFSHDHKSYAVAKKIVDSGTYKELPNIERFFVNVSFEHQEDKDIQARSVALFTELVKDAKGSPEEELSEKGLTASLQHQEVVNQYGRFPKRNAAIGRTNTPEEEIFLRDNTYGF